MSARVHERMMMRQTGRRLIIIFFCTRMRTRSKPASCTSSLDPHPTPAHLHHQSRHPAPVSYVERLTARTGDRMIQDRPGRPSRQQIATRVADAIERDHPLELPDQEFETWLRANVPAQVRVLLIEFRSRGIINPT